MERTAKGGRFAAVFAYFTIIGTVIAFFMNNDDKHPLASFHIRQALGIHISFYLLGSMVSWFDSWMVSVPFYFFIIPLWGYGFVTAIQGQQNPTPILGKYFQNWFSGIR